MNTFDRIRCIDNITIVVKELGKKLGEVESKAGESPGKLSRLRNNEGKGNFSVELLYEISKQLGHTMDYLANYDRGAPITENDKYLLNFLDCLTFDAEHHNTEWQMMDARILKNTYLFKHPLFFQTTQWKYDTYDDAPVEEEVMKYNSAFDETAEINGHCYYADLGNDIGSSIYIMNCRYSSQDDSIDHIANIYEMYFIDKKESINPLVSSFQVGEEVRAAMKALYEAVEGARSHIRLDEHSKNLINRYMAHSKARSEKED